MKTSKIRDLILDHLQNSKYTPLEDKELMKALKIAPSFANKFKRALSQLINSEEIKVQNRCYVPVSHEKWVMKGVFYSHPRGFGFVQPEEGSEIIENVFIPRDYTQGAINHDLVSILVDGDKKAKGYEGKVLKVIERKTKVIIGTAFKVLKNEILIFSPLLGEKKQISMKPPKKKVNVGDRILMKVISWGGNKQPITTKYEKLLGNIDDPEIDIDVAIDEHEIRKTFPKPCKKQADDLGSEVKEEDQKGREDLKGLECITIDPDTAKDFDDALSLTIDEKGNYHLGVHIADVSHYVQPESPIDVEAIERGNSTYFPGNCIPMLPKNLSNGLCSLKPKVVRLAASVLIDLDPNGNILNYKIVRSVIKSRKRFTYKEALEVLEGRKKSQHAPLIKNLERLAKLLKKKRRERGSIDFAVAEGYIHLDKKGNPTSIETIEYDITHQMVEDFMLIANELVARHLHEKLGRALYRVHEEPDIENFEDFFHLASMLGFNTPKKPEIKHLQQVFDQARDSSHLPILSVQFIRSLKLAAYSPNNVGHFGLALEHYCHFTSPIRRYSDLVIHRLLFVDDYEVNLEKVAVICSDSERKSMRAENSVLLLKKLRLLKKEYNKDPDKKYIATITRVFPMRIVFEIDGFFVEGTCHVSKLADYFHYQNGSLIGEKTNKELGFGDKIEVQCKGVDLIFNQSQWHVTI